MSWFNTGERGWAYRGELPMKSVENLTIETLLQEREKLVAELAQLQERIATQDDGLRYSEQVCARLVEERDEAKRNAIAWSDERDSMRRERDEARAEVERLRVACDGCADSEAKTGKAHYDDCPVAVLQAELDEARSEVERLRAALRSIAEGFGRIDGTLNDPARQVDGYFRGFAVAALEKKP